VANALIYTLITNQSFAQNTPAAKTLPSSADNGSFAQDQKNSLPIIEKYSLSQSLINQQIGIIWLPFFGQFLGKKRKRTKSLLSTIN
jgi:hypothetical protein